ncbi:MAG: HD domain-containing protein [Lachnospiraceae bacterium]|nr:HD domain-containing protein [Lachnospiraceae bacterium]
MFKKINEKKLKSFIDYFSYCFIMFTVIIFFMAFVRTDHKGEAYIGSFDSDYMNTGWTLEAGGVTSDVTLPVTADAHADDWVIIRNTLPENIPGNQTILFRTMMEDVYIYVGGELRVSYSSDGFDKMSYHLPSAYVACEIGPDDAGKTIEARFLVKTIATIESVRIGEGSNAWFAIIHENMLLLATALMILVTGVFVILFYLFSRERFRIDRSFFYMGLFMVSLSTWMISESRLRQVIFARPSLTNYFSFFALEITGVFVCSYFDEIQSRVYHKLYLALETLVTVQIIANLALNALGIADFFVTLIITYIWIALGIIAVISTLIRDIIEKMTQNYIAIFIGTCIFLICCMLEIASFFLSNIWHFGFFICVGMLGLLIATIVQTALRQEKYSIEREHEKEDSLMNTIEAITGAIDAKDEYTGGHSDRVGIYAGMIAREMAADYDFSEEDILRIRYIGFMHDIGKIGVADSVLNKAGRLTDEEFTLMKKHVEIGYDLLKSMDNSIEGLPEGIRYHHEKFDGSGYPDGLAGTEIPLVARILCVADSYDAMTSNRVYRKRLSDEEVIAEIKRCSGKQFDPAIAGIFIRMIERGDFKASTVEGMEVNEQGNVYRSSLLERHLQTDIKADPDRVFHPSHVRMICYVMKLAEKNDRQFDVFFAGIIPESCAHDGEECTEHKPGRHGITPEMEERFDAHIRKILGIRDISIDYDAESNIIVLFDRNEEEMKKIREDLSRFDGASVFIKEL